MLIFWRQRLVILANPKTGTTALEETLAPLAAVVVQRPPQLKHTGAGKYHKFLAPYVGDGKDHTFQIVGVMREPVDWLGSWYRYRQRNEEVTDKSTHDISFDDFVRAWCTRKPPEPAPREGPTGPGRMTERLVVVRKRVTTVERRSLSSKAA